MEVVLAIVAGGLFAGGFYCLMRRSIVRLVIGVLLMSQAVNLLILTSAGLTPGQPPLIGPTMTVLPTEAADPLPQALILTAIVIAFGVTAFLLVLVRKAYQRIQDDDFDAFISTED